MVLLEVELVDALLDYNLLLSRICTYVMQVVVSFYRVVKFPYKGKTMTIDQLSFYHKISVQLEPNVPMVDNSIKVQQNVDVGLYPSVMGTFTLLVSKIYMISCVTNDPSIR